MDATSPGNLPTSLGTVWIGTTAADPWAAYGASHAVAGNTVIIDQPPVGAQNCIIEPFPMSPTFIPLGPTPTVPVCPTHTHYHFTPAAPLSDTDVERIAKRVVELLREAKP